jgi:hypothetical protein
MLASANLGAFPSAAFVAHPCDRPPKTNNPQPEETSSHSLTHQSWFFLLTFQRNLGPSQKLTYTQDQYVCQSNHRIAEAVTGVLGGAQFSSGPFYHPRSSRGRFGHPREAAVCAGNFPDSNGISGDFKRQNRSHQTEPVPATFRHPNSR